VQIAPDDFRKQSHVAIEDNINSKYANKVVQKIGLCVCLWDILWTSEGLIGQGDGMVNVNSAQSPPSYSYVVVVVVVVVGGG
jgi:DNA-directed RNA polymerase III subunit RPC8